MSEKQANFRAAHFTRINGMKPKLFALSLIAWFVLCGCRKEANPGLQKEISVLPASARLVDDPRLGSMTSVSITVLAAHPMKKLPKLATWMIRDQKGEVYRFFDFPDGKGGTRRTAIYVRGLDSSDYSPSSNVTFSVLFPLDQIPTNAGAVYLEGSLDVGLSKPESFRLQVR